MAVPLHNIVVLGGHFEDAWASITLIYHAVEVTVTIDLSGSTRPTIEEYAAAYRKLEPPGAAFNQAYRGLQHLLLDPIWSSIELECHQIQPTPHKSLQTFLSCPHLEFRLDKDGRMERSQAPHASKYHVKPLALDQLVIPSSVARMSVARTAASEVTFSELDVTLPILEQDCVLENGQPARFVTCEEGRDMYFKPELEVRIRLHEARISSSHCIPRFLGIVTSLARHEVAGYVQQQVHGTPLADITSKRRTRSQRYWLQQTVDAIRAVHTLGLYCGNVNEHSIVIDSDGVHGNAWLTSFPRDGTTSWEDKTWLDAQQQLDVDRATAAFA